MEGLEESMADLLVGLVEEELDMSWVSRLGAFNQTFIPPIATITNTFIERLNGDCRKVCASAPSSYWLNLWGPVSSSCMGVTDGAPLASDFWSQEGSNPGRSQVALHFIGPAATLVVLLAIQRAAGPRR